MALERTTEATRATSAAAYRNRQPVQAQLLASRLGNRTFGRLLPSHTDRKDRIESLVRLSKRAQSDKMVLALQRAAGNGAVTAMLERDRHVLARCQGQCTCAGRCTEEEPFGEVGVRPLSRAALYESALRERDSSVEAPTRLLRKFSTGAAVEELQTLLNSIGVIPALEVDRRFGTQTDLAVRFFQEAHRLVVDGIVGRETRSMLDRETALHGDEEEVLARGGGPCHTPDAPGPDELAVTTTPNAPPTAAGPRTSPALLGFGSTPAGGPGTPTPPAQPQPADLVVRLSNGSLERDLSEAASAPGSSAEVVRTRRELIDLLRRRGNVGRLIIVSHGTTAGAVNFENEGNPTKLEDLANDLRGVAKVREVAFRGCNVGNDAKGLNEVKGAVGAISTEGSNCSLTVAHGGPITVNKVSIDSETKYQALKKKQKAEYDKRLRAVTRGHGDCIVELQPGQTLADVSDDTLRGFAMRHGGRLIMQYTPDNTCWQDLKFGGSAPCKRIQAR